MANHCIYTACAGCGAWYCLRFCGDATGPDEKSRTIVKDKIKNENALKYEDMFCCYCQAETLYKI